MDVFCARSPELENPTEASLHKRRAAERRDLCSDLSEAGLINISLLGCSETEISPSISILRRRGLVCREFAESGLDARALGCSADLLPEGSISKRDLLSARDEKCASLAALGMTGLGELGCAAEFSQSLVRRTFHTDTCVCPPPSNPPGPPTNPPGPPTNPPGPPVTPPGPPTNPPGPPTNPPAPPTNPPAPPSQPPGPPTTPPGPPTNPPSPPSNPPGPPVTPPGPPTNPPGPPTNPPGPPTNPPGTPPSCPNPPPGGNPTPPTGPTTPCDTNPDNFCQIISKAGLINLDLLGCFNLKFDPSISIGQSLIPAGVEITESLLGLLSGGGALQGKAVGGGSGGGILGGLLGGLVPSPPGIPSGNVFASKQVAGQANADASGSGAVHVKDTVAHITGQGQGKAAASADANAQGKAAANADADAQGKVEAKAKAQGKADAKVDAKANGTADANASAQQ